MNSLKGIFRAIRISIFVLHTLWVVKSIVEILKVELLKGYDIFQYALITFAFLASYILFSMLYEKTIPQSKRSDKILSRFVYMFETMLITSGVMALFIVFTKLFLN